MSRPEGWPPDGSAPSAYVAFWKRKVDAEMAEAQAQHERVCSGIDGALLRVAQHHHPVAGSKSLYCNGCYLEWEDAAGPWPCPTWKLIDPDAEKP